MLKSARSCLGLMIGLGALVGCIQNATPTETAGSTTQAMSDSDKMLKPFVNAGGKAQTTTASGSIDTSGLFFTALRLHDRHCGSCHQADAGWTISSENLRSRYDATDGLDSVFRPFDGANYPAAPVGTSAERAAAYTRLLERGTIRVQLPASTPTRQFKLVSVAAPVGEPVAAGFPAGTMSFYRRPLPISNLRFASSVNWDGRSSVGAPALPILTGLLNQSNGATLNHAWFPSPAGTFVPLTTGPTGERQQIVDQELSFHHAQTMQTDAGQLDHKGATGGAANLLTQSFTPGATSPGSTFTLYDAWVGHEGARGRIANGQSVFNAKCAGCHNTPNIGTSATAIFRNVGVSQTGNPASWVSDIPLYTFERLAIPGDPSSGTGELISTTDPGRALFSNQWTDMNKFKVPALRGLASRAPYFHDGSVRTIAGVVDHYESVVGISFAGAEEKADLVMFLESL